VPLPVTYPLNAELALNIPLESATTIREPVPERLAKVVIPVEPILKATAPLAINPTLVDDPLYTPYPVASPSLNKYPLVFVLWIIPATDNLFPGIGTPTPSSPVVVRVINFPVVFHQSNPLDAFNCCKIVEVAAALYKPKKGPTPNVSEPFLFTLTNDVDITPPATEMLVPSSCTILLANVLVPVALGR